MGCRGRLGASGVRRSWLLLFSISIASFMTISGAFTGCGGTDMASTTATPDFTLSVLPATASLTGGAAGQSVSVLASGMNGFAAPVSDLR